MSIERTNAVVLTATAKKAKGGVELTTAGGASIRLDLPAELLGRIVPGQEYGIEIQAVKPPPPPPEEPAP